MKKIISVFLVLVLALGCIPVRAFAAESEEVCAVAPYGNNASLIETTREGSPIRTGPGESYSTVVCCERGTVLEKKGTKINRYLNSWHKVTYRDGQSNRCYTGYIYSKNTQKHSHQYEVLEYDGVVYKYCDCGKITVRVENEYRVKKTEAVAIASTAAGTLAAVDGVVPVGDLIGVGLLITVGIMDAAGVIPATEDVLEVYEDIDFDQFSDDDECPINSYRRVSRDNGTLSYTDNECLSIIEAYVWVRTGNDVWCCDWDTAFKLGSLHKDGCFSEIDSSDKDYWYHFHLGSCTPSGKHLNVVGGHIFYGASAITHRLPN